MTPGGAGGANWAAMSLDQKTGLLYVPAAEVDFAYSDGLPYGQPTFYEPQGEFRGGVLDAVNPRTNKIAWQRDNPLRAVERRRDPDHVGRPAFRGRAQRHRSPPVMRVNGKVLWSWQTGTGIATTPVTYTANGVQYVAIFAGGNASL